MRNSQAAEKFRERETVLREPINFVSDSVPINPRTHEAALCYYISIYLRLLHATPVVMLDWLERFDDRRRPCDSCIL